jgi:cytidylate kinase
MIITISRQFGAGGSEVAERVSTALGWHLVDNDLVEKVAARTGMSPEEVAQKEERAPSFIERLTRTLASQTPQLMPPEGGTVKDLEEQSLVQITERVVSELARQGRVVFVGRAAPAVIGLQAEALHVKLVAPRAWRTERIRERFGITAEEAERQIDQVDSQRARYHKEYYQRTWGDPVNYHLTINTGLVGLDAAADLILGYVRRARPDQ